MENEVSYRIHKSPPPTLALGQINQFTPPLQFLKIHFNIILPYTPRPPKWPLSLRSAHQNLYAPLLSPRSLRPCGMFRHIVSFYGEVLLAHVQPPSGGPPFAGCPRLLSQYIRSCLPYLGPAPPPPTSGRSMPWWEEPKFESWKGEIHDGQCGWHSAAICIIMSSRPIWHEDMLHYN
jgi:hypothetical protein